MSLSAAKRWGSPLRSSLTLPSGLPAQALSAVQMAYQVLEFTDQGRVKGAHTEAVMLAARMSAQGSTLEAYSFPSNLTAHMVWHPEPPNELPVLFKLLVTVILFFFFLPFWIHWTHVGLVQRKYGESHPNPCHSRDAESQTQSREHQLGIVLTKCFYFCKVTPAIWPAPNSIPG